MLSGRAWRLLKFGPPEESIQLQEVAFPAPQPGHLLIRVRSAGAGYPDAMMAAGQFPLLGEPPFGLGEEAAGEVLAAPAGSRFAIGDRVAGITAFLNGWGGYAEYTYLREESSIVIPQGMTFDEAGGFPIAFRTAYAGLAERTRLEPGQTLLVLGAAGSSGGAAVQLGRAIGAYVIAVAGGPEKADFCRSHGANQVIDYRSEDVASRISELTGGRGVDVIYDPVGGEFSRQALQGIARGGRLVLMGLASGSPVSLDAMDLLLRNYTAVGVLATPSEPALELSIWRHLAELAAERKITTPVGQVYDFDQVPRMIANQSAPAPGKTVVRVSSSR